jgi:hypothetical protein
VPASPSRCQGSRRRYYGLLANRNREKALELCRKVLPGSPARKVQKMDWRDRLQSLTGIDPMQCEVCGQKAPPSGGNQGTGSGAEGSTPMTQPPIAQFQYFFAQPWS